MVSVLLMLSGSPTAIAETIKIGVPLAMTGAYAGSGDNYWKGITMAVDEINDGGGLLGKQVEIVRFDSQEFAPETVMQGANYLCGEKTVSSVHAGWAGWGQDVRAYGKFEVPFFCDDGAEPAVNVYKSNPEQYSNIYFLTDTGKDQGKSIFTMLKSLPYDYPNKKVVIINTDDTWGMKSGIHWKRISKKWGGVSPCTRPFPTVSMNGVRFWLRFDVSGRRSFMWRSPAHRKWSLFFINSLNSLLTPS